ncbi:MAG: RNA 3'-terminal phosphate cyclase [Chloroflexia bacterium]|nr:RNA 3'-terminal phosphate cyclase [Chloroflexia bacterium]
MLEFFRKIIFKYEYQLYISIFENIFDVTLIDTKDYFEFTPGILRTIVEPKHARSVQQLHSHYLSRAKIVVGEVKNISKNFTRSYLGVDDHLSDMLVVPASLVNETSFYRIKEITKHLETNLYVTSKITGCKYGIGKLDDGYELRISGNSNSTLQ